MAEVQLRGAELQPSSYPRHTFIKHMLEAITCATTMQVVLCKDTFLTQPSLSHQLS